MVKKSCENCKRVRGIRKHGLCTPCLKAYESAPEGPEREKALEEVRLRIEKKEERREAKKDKNAGKRSNPGKASPPERPSKAAPQQSIDKPIILHITFSGNDKNLYHAFEEVAGRNRRTVANEILSMIERKLTIPSLDGMLTELLPLVHGGKVDDANSASHQRLGDEGGSRP